MAGHWTAGTIGLSLDILGETMAKLRFRYYAKVTFTYKGIDHRHLREASMSHHVTGTKARFPDKEA